MIKSIKKARKNGWDKFDHYNKFEMHGDDTVKFISDDKCEMTKGIAYVHINEIIFDIDFAEAFWECTKNCNDEVVSMHEWEYRLQQIAIKEDRIAYLNKFN